MGHEDVDALMEVDRRIQQTKDNVENPQPSPEEIVAALEEAVASRPDPYPQPWTMRLGSAEDNVGNEWVVWEINADAILDAVFIDHEDPAGPRAKLRLFSDKDFPEKVIAMIRQHLHKGLAVPESPGLILPGR